MIDSTWVGHSGGSIDGTTFAVLLNGMALHGGIIPYEGKFLVFSDYMLPAMRLAAMMRLWVIYVFIRDSIDAGEDGPTHHPVEHLVFLRFIPNMLVIRPSDANEVAVTWRIALQRTDGPTALICSRQGVPTLDRQMPESAEGVACGKSESMRRSPWLGRHIRGGEERPGDRCMHVWETPTDMERC